MAMLGGQRAVVVAYLLHLLGRDRGFRLPQQLRLQIVALVLEMRIDPLLILSTLRFREELRECRRVMLPSAAEMSDDDEQEEEDDDDACENERFLQGDEDWIIQSVIHRYGLSPFKYFALEINQEHEFASWSTDGIAAVAYSIFVEVNDPRLSIVLSPFSWLFMAVPTIRRMLDTTDLAVRNAVAP